MKNYITDVLVISVLSHETNMFLLQSRLQGSKLLVKALLYRTTTAVLASRALTHCSVGQSCTHNILNIGKEADGLGRQSEKYFVCVCARVHERPQRPEEDINRTSMTSSPTLCLIP